jgi:hypothetical protein
MAPDDLAALDFDLTCTYCLQAYDIEVAEKNAQQIALEVGKMLTGEKGNGAKKNGKAPKAPPAKIETVIRV